MSKPVSSASPRAESGELSFEQALAELEKIVARMESGELSLEQALAAHKRGLELARACQQRLEAAQQQVKVLEGEVLKPLAAAAVEPAAPGNTLLPDPEDAPGAGRGDAARPSSREGD